ncbi:MAG: helix-turn-helix transcriptional regulator [Rhodobiaceae bacterium]|nr:helix-turn-helix transcriptional regulator [Rhodobiaceae bacterium]
MSQDQKPLLPPDIAENIRQNLWIYRTYQNQTRRQMADASLKSSTLRAYEYGFRPVTRDHLPLIAERLSVSETTLAAPPDFALLLDWQTRRVVEYYRTLTDNQRHAIKRLLMHM